uniref:YopX protein domain-containing protein n=2 Tax=Acrobeloides nanus TaxID=290746 RepID=A0A914DZE4_9BILA
MIQIQYRPGCTKDGKNFKEGEVYRVEHLIYKCENDFMFPQGCYTTDGNDIKIGQKVMDYDKNSIYECFGANLKIGYNEKYCGRFHPCEDFPEEEKKKFKPQHHYRVYSEAIINP